MADHEALADARELLPEERLKQEALRRTKAIATAALVLCVAVFLAARAFQTNWPMLSYVAAFAEAAAIGGLADWYAVVALFRRPLGLPIPHTAIIPANKDRIASNLGRFIEVNFLAPEPVRAKLQQVDFAQMVADWLTDRARSDELSRFVGRIAPQALTAVEGSGVGDFVTRRLVDQLDKIKIAPLAADMLGAITADRRHQKLLDEILVMLGGFLRDEAALDALRDKIRDELPSLARFFRADAYLLKKIVASASTLITEVDAAPDHPLRAEFDQFVEKFIGELRTSAEYEMRADKLKRDLLARPELKTLATSFWESLRVFIEQDINENDSVVRRHLTDMFVEVGRQLAAEPRIRAEMNEGFVVALSSFVEVQKSGVSAFIGDQVRSWDIVQLTRLIELNIGRDLQYIRFNGMLIGGLAGLVLHIADRLLFAN